MIFVLFMAVGIAPASNIELNHQRYVRTDINRRQADVEEAEDDGFFDFFALAWHLVSQRPED